MAIDESPRQDMLSANSPGSTDHTTKFVAIFVVLALLAIGEIYSLTRMTALHASLETQQAAMQRALSAQIDQQFASRVSALENSTSQQLEAVKTELDAAAKRMGSTGRELRRSRAMVEQIQAQQKEQAEKLQGELAQKADQQQVGALTQDVSATRTDLDSTKKTLDATRADLGMARSELGTLIARNHDDIETLRKLGERDYFEFTLNRNSPVHIANVGLLLKKTNVKRHRFNVALQVDDMEIEKKDRTVNEPVFFYIKGARKPYEIVVNKVESKLATGYLSTPKGAVEVASRSEGTQK